MNAEAPTHTDSIKLIRAKIEEHRLAAAEIAKDKTVEICQRSLEAAQKEVQDAAVEDESVDPEELVDRRFEAGRQVEIAQIRLERAKKTYAQRMREPEWPLVEAKKIACELLNAAAQPLREKLMAGAVRVFGEDEVASESSFYKSVIYRASERLLSTARYLEKSGSNAVQMVRDLEDAIQRTEDAHRER